MKSLQCPVCRLPLLQTHKHGRLHFSCPQFHGSALSASVVRGWLKEEALPAFDKSFAAPCPGRKPCPRCREAMAEFGSALKLDAYSSCGLIWFDGQELERLWKKPDRELDAQAEEKSVMGIEDRVGELFPSIEGLKGGNAGVPWVTIGLILACTVITRLGMAGGELKFLFDPQHPFAHFGATAVLSILAHADMGHLSGNMIVFFFAGVIVESCFGEKILLQIFFLCGLIGMALQGTMEPNIFALGASGAIAGVLTVLCLTQPDASLVTRSAQHVGWGEFYTFTLRIPIPVLFAVFLGMQLYGGYEQAKGIGSGVSYYGHLGGIIAGAVFVFTSQLKVLAPSIKKAE